MNLYNLHSDPESLKYHDVADEYVPALFWNKYKNNPEELKKREDIIAKDAFYSYLYATNVLKGQFTKGEDVIAKYAEYSYAYAAHAINCPFSKGEDSIAKDVVYSYAYALNVLKGPFPKGEAIIMQSSYVDRYKKLL